MNPEDREAFYDAEIAPALLALAKKCQDNGLSMVAEVEWVTGEGGTTATMQPGAGPTMRMVYMAARSRGNVDGLIFGLVRDGREHGHSSLCLSVLEGRGPEGGAA